MRILILIAVVLLPLFFLTNCNKDENLLPSESSDTAFYFASMDFTVKEYAEYAHLTLRAWYGKIVGFAFSDYCTDIYTWGSDNRTGSFYNADDYYQRGLIERNDMLRKELDRGILFCEKAIEKASESSAGYTSEIAEVRFLKALYSWLVVEIWGDIDVEKVYEELLMIWIMRLQIYLPRNLQILC